VWGRGRESRQRAEGLVDAWAWACFWKRESLHEVWKVRVGPRLVY